MTLGEKQRVFVKLVGLLIGWAYENGYELTFGEALRTPEQALLYSKQGKGKKNSLHIDRLAIDLNLFKNGVYMKESESYRPLGKFWESLAEGEIVTCWGGNFTGPIVDGNHFSIAHGGRR